jgi:WD40 repeat protein
VRQIAFLADRTVAVTGEDRGLSGLLDLQTRQPLGPPPTGLTGTIQALAFSPAGSRLLTGTWDRKTAQLWDTATGKPLGPPIVHGEPVHLVGFTADGRTTVTCSMDQQFRRLQVPQPLPGEVEQVRCWVEVLTGMELDASGVARNLDPTRLMQRRRRLQELGGPPDGKARP